MPKWWHVAWRRGVNGDAIAVLPRPVRAGFPDVGKSALINPVPAASGDAARPGVTRQLRWIRICDQLELLDAPGHPCQVDQTDA